jgi:hypothetical protein
VFKDLMKDFAAKQINFTIVRVNNSCDQMIKVLGDIYKSHGMALNVTDLADACKNLSQAEVTKKFVEAASFMLSTSLGGTSGKGTGKRTG